MRVNLYYLSDSTTGGWVTFTRHLVYALEEAGVDTVLYKTRNRTEGFDRPFGYGLQYRNLALDDAVSACRKRPSVILAIDKHHREQAAALVAAGSLLVVHDPAEFPNLKEIPSFDPGKTVVIRRSVQRVVPGSVYVPHPYRRRYKPGTFSTAEGVACSVCRIDFDKNTTMILDANRLLPEDRRVLIRGAENRRYTRCKVLDKYPEWQQSTTQYAREEGIASDLCHGHVYAVDLSVIKGDGGGTQYSFMEAADAGAVNVIHRNWLTGHSDDEMVPFPRPGANCFAVGTAQELVDLLSENVSDVRRRRLVAGSDRLLSAHAPTNAASALLPLLRRTARAAAR